jgi:NADH-quinone oxidoreductase subunit N
VLAVLTMTVGNLVALRQRVAVRLLAWSTVAQAGWVLVPLAAAADGSADTIRDALSASAGYLLAYVVASLAAFTVVVLLARHHPAGEEHTLDAYRGLARSEPVASAVLGLALACLAGLPPGVMGLVAKVIAVRPLVDSGAWVIAVIAAVNVAIGLAYYLRWAGLLVARPEGAPPRWRVTAAEGIVLGGAAAGCIGLSVGGQALANLMPGLLR